GDQGGARSILLEKGIQVYHRTAPLRKSRLEGFFQAGSGRGNGSVSRPFGQYREGGEILKFGVLCDRQKGGGGRDRTGGDSGSRSATHCGKNRREPPRSTTAYEEHLPKRSQTGAGDTLSGT